MNGYETVTEAAASVRAAFKAHGWTSRQVSVRADSYSMGSAIRITVKDGSIPLHLIKSVAEGKEHIRRDGWGEILSGGNRYVTVSLSREAIELKARRYVEAVEKAIERLKGASFSTLEPIACGYLLGRGEYGDRLALWGDSHIVERSTPEDIAFSLAVQVEEYGWAGHYSDWYRQRAAALAKVKP